MIGSEEKVYKQILTEEWQDNFGIFESEKCRNLAIFGQIWLNFGFKRSFQVVKYHLFGHKYRERNFVFLHYHTNNINILLFSGLVPREKSTLGKQSLKSLPDPDQMEKSTIQRKTLDPVWEERFELLLVEQPRVLVMEVWDDDMAQQSEGRNAIKGLRGLRFKIIDFFSPGQDDFLGKYILNCCIKYWI